MTSALPPELSGFARKSRTHRARALDTVALWMKAGAAPALVRATPFRPGASVRSVTQRARGVSTGSNRFMSVG